MADDADLVRSLCDAFARGDVESVLASFDGAIDDLDAGVPARG